ncbi:alpha/beta hydrolase [Curtobacterium sp. MCBD17_003]|uniref:alpha/beta fold hydrolase n=1 Tax=Curtobacterium sp. MCBD17_003 TaxID=2175667 RepID=UPI000DA92A6A|nr:alpha/beta hydrolase [Curtobacterium sp. MCBD17_003]WIE53748.1 alpha/beta hydrolase [Curtobacterium sp. MCBD17_003]
MPIVSTPVADLEYHDDGPADGTPVLLLHGFPDTPATWDGVLALLPDDVRAIRPMLRGVGASRVRDDAADARSGQVAALAADVLDLADALRLDRFLLAGHDWGARAAHAVAVLAPERLTGLVTIATPYGDRGHLSAAERLDDAAVAWYRYWLCTEAGARAFRTDPTALVRWAWANWSPSLRLDPTEEQAMLGAFDTDEFAADVVHYYRHGAGEAPGSPRYASTQALLDTWPAITVPTTFLIGTADGCETLPAARGNEASFASGRDLVELPGVGHFVQREDPVAVAAAVRAHLDRVRLATDA